MSNRAIRGALEVHLKALDPAFPTAWTNVNFVPPSTAFQVPDFLFAEPDDAGYKDSGYIQRGLLWVRLFYPTNTGAGTAEVKAQQIRDHFPRGSSYPTVEDFVVNIDRTPEITGGEVVEGRFLIATKVRFYAHVEQS